MRWCSGTGLDRDQDRPRPPQASLAVAFGNSTKKEGSNAEGTNHNAWIKHR